jgi:outer membrane lipoprotein-sorting protein
MKIIFAFVLLVIVAVGCTQKQQTKAVIFERKEVGEGRLAIAYTFNVNGTIYTDSAQIENKALLTDTLNIVYPVGKPMESTPEILNR